MSRPRKPFDGSIRNTRLLRKDNELYFAADCLQVDGSFKPDSIPLEYVIDNRWGAFRKELTLRGDMLWLSKYGTELHVKPIISQSERDRELVDPQQDSKTERWICLEDYIENKSGKLTRIHSRFRTLVLCLDGTSNHFNERNTNIVKLMGVLKRDNPARQLVYYQPGVGTYTTPGIFNPVTQTIAKWADQATAWYLGQHIMDAYKFLSQTYTSGDKICIFGFSRGAYTAMALVGMLHKVGLLPPHNWEHIPFAFQLYKNDDRQCEMFRRKFSRIVEVQFLGLWDAVNSTGLLNTTALPCIDMNPILKTCRHALALDERRVKFSPTFYRSALGNNNGQNMEAMSILETSSTVDVFTKDEQITPNGSSSGEAHKREVDLTTQNAVRSGNNQLSEDNRTTRVLQATEAHVVDETPSTLGSSEYSRIITKSAGGGLGTDTNRTAVLDVEEVIQNLVTPTFPDVEEVWFAGDHCDVGGGHEVEMEFHNEGLLEFLDTLQVEDQEWWQAVYNRSPRSAEERSESGQSEQSLSWIHPRHRERSRKEVQTLADLSTCSLRWMISQIHQTSADILFDEAALMACKIWAQTSADGCLLRVDPTAKDLENEDLSRAAVALQNGDVAAEQHDALRGFSNPFWWMMELTTWRRHSWQLRKAKPEHDSGSRIRVYLPHCGRARVLPNSGNQPIKVHVSVKQRMERTKIGYSDQNPVKLAMHWLKTLKQSVKGGDPDEPQSPLHSNREGSKSKARETHGKARKMKPYVPRARTSDGRKFTDLQDGEILWVQ